MKFELEPYHRNVPDDEMIQDIVRVASKIGRGTITMNEYMENGGKYYSSTFLRRFGSWFKVLELANLSPSRQKFNITDQELFNNIEELWIQLGRQPKNNELKEINSKFSCNTYSRRFGTWRNALAAFVDFINQDETEEPLADEKYLAIEDLHIKPLHKTSRKISERLRFRILVRDGFRCLACGRSPLSTPGTELHVDHIIPWSKGGETTPENLQTKCAQCNLGKGNAFDK
jgi:hypothetical protein